MKKIVLGVLVAAMLCFVPQSAYALPPDFIFSAHGIVTENGLPVEGAAVFVECGPDGVPTGTNADGSYNVSFSTCFLGSTVYVRAAKGDSFGRASVLGTTVTTLNVELFKSNPADTVITGNVSDHGFVVRGAKVIVKCRSTERETLTDNHGEYSVILSPADCPVGSTVQVLASADTRSGMIFAEVKVVNTINIAVANVGIPEYGVLGGILAAGAGVGFVIFYRRRYARQV